MININKSPFPVRYRELWLPESINGTILPSSRYNGHALALTGAQKRTTSDGVRGTGANTSNINCGAIHDNIAKLWVSLRFKLDQAFIAGMGEQYLWGKRIDGDNLLALYLDNNGMLHFYMRTAATDRFILLSTITSWTADTWYHALASLSDTAGGIQRLKVNNNLEDSDVQAAANTPNGGDLVLLDLDDAGFGNGFKGVVTDVFIGTDALTSAEETDLYNGFPPADVVNEYLLDEGRGVTAYDRGSGANNGTLDTACTWAWGQVKQPVLSFDSINDFGQSSSGVNIRGELTAIWVAKLKSTYKNLSDYHKQYRYYVDANNYLQGAPDAEYMGSGVSVALSYTKNHSIDDYGIYMTTVKIGQLGLFKNGTNRGTSGLTAYITGDATAYIGRVQAGTYWDISKPLFIAIIDGAFTDKQALAYSRWLRDKFNLPISM